MTTFHILTIFPEFFDSPLHCSLLGKAEEKGLLSFHITDIRRFSTNKHASVDDSPYGGGAGMLMKPEPIVAAIRHVEETYGRCYKVLLSPRGRLFSHQEAESFAKHERILLLCGRYEGVDERIHLHYVDEVCSLGDFVVTGGEAPALMMIDAISRFIPGVVGKEESVQRDSFQKGMLCHPQYTRPQEFEGHKVPDVLLSGNHREIKAWRKEEARKTTKRYRPELLS